MVELRSQIANAQRVLNEDSNLRYTLGVVQRLIYQGTAPNLRSQINEVQRVTYQQELPNLRSQINVIQYIQRAPETNVSTDLYPELPGLTYGVGAVPTFSTSVQTHTSGKETRTAYWEDPKWRFELQYDYLPNKTSDSATDFKKLVGFFCARKGSFDTFLFRAPDDNAVVRTFIGEGDGVESEYRLVRPLHTYLEPIGQVDSETLVVYVEGPEASSVPADPGPYTITLSNSVIDAVVSVVVDGVAFTPVPTAPGPGEYSIDLVTATITFPAASAGDPVVVTYRWVAQSGVDYSVLMPRTVVFVAPPVNGSTITATFSYFFVCRFMEDMAEFEQFYDKLYELGKIELMSQII